MKNFEAQGFSKTKAFETTGIDVELNMLKNATQAWKKAGSPLNTKTIGNFMAAYIKDKKAVGAYIVVEAASDDTRLRPYQVINEVTTGKRKTSTVYQVKEAELAVKYVKDTKVVKTKVKDEEGNETEVEKTVDFLNPYHKETIKVVSKVKDEDGVETEVEKMKEVDVANVKVLSVGAVEGHATKKSEAFKIMKDLIEANNKDYVVEIVKEVTEGQRYAGYGQYTPSKSAKMGKFLFYVNE